MIPAQLQNICERCPFTKGADGKCDQCIMPRLVELFSQPEAQPLTVGQVLHGAAGLAKAALGIDRASDETIEARSNICLGCDRAKTKGGKLLSCKECGCKLKAKLVLRSEACPLGKWGKE